MRAPIGSTRRSTSMRAWSRAATPTTSRRSRTRSSRSSARASTSRWRPRPRGQARSLHAVIRPRLLLLTFALVFAGAAVPAGAATYTDLGEFRAAAGGRLIDWEDHAAGAVGVDDYRSRGVVLAAPGEVTGPSGSHVFETTDSPTTTISFAVPAASAVTRGFGARFSNPAQ